MRAKVVLMPPSISGFRRGKNLINFYRKIAGNACGAVSAEVKVLVLMESGKSQGY